MDPEEANLGNGVLGNGLVEFLDFGFFGSCVVGLFLTVLRGLRLGGSAGLSSANAALTGRSRQLSKRIRTHPRIGSRSGVSLPAFKHLSRRNRANPRDEKRRNILIRLDPILLDFKIKPIAARQSRMSFRPTSHPRTCFKSKATSSFGGQNLTLGVDGAHHRGNPTRVGQDFIALERRMGNWLAPLAGVLRIYASAIR